MAEVRLQKAMADAGVASRRASEKLILEGRVKVNGVVVKELGTKVKGDDAIEVNGTLIERERNKVYYLFYKPRGVISAVKDDKGRRVVTDYFEGEKNRIYPIGRLDYDTSGILILTNDGELANLLMHPRYKVDKTYVAKVEGLVQSDDLKRLRKGVKMKDGHYSARAKAKVISIGNPVMKLKRETYDFLTLKGLTSGQYRELSNEEVKTLYENARKNSKLK